MRENRMQLMALVAGAVALLLFGGAAKADPITFEGYKTGSVNGQAGWTVEDSFGNSFAEGGYANNPDEGIKNDGTGNTVWRLSNAYTFGGFSAQPFSPTTQVAGETGSSLWNDYGTDHTDPYNPPHAGASPTTNRFTASFDFKSATGDAQSGLQIDISPSAKQSTVRMSFLRIADSGSGLDLIFNGDYGNIMVASGLSYTAWHSITMDITFLDGVDHIDPDGTVWGNDIVDVYVDGSLMHTGTTWESYYYDYERIDPEDPRLQAVDSLMFQARKTPAYNTLGEGLYFDNIDLTPAPEPITMVMLGCLGGGMALARKLRRKSA